MKIVITTTVLVLVVLVMVGIERGEGSLCKTCSCMIGGVVNCAGHGLKEIPLLTPDDVGQIGFDGIISFKENPELEENGERLKSYLPYIRLFEFDWGSGLCQDIRRFAAKWTEPVTIYGCPNQREEDEETEITATTAAVEGKSKKRHIEPQEIFAGDVNSLKKSWVVNTVFGWIGFVASGIITAVVLRCYARRGAENGEVDRIRAFLRRYYGRRRLQEFGINCQLPGDADQQIPPRDPEDVLYHAEDLADGGGDDQEHTDDDDDDDDDDDNKIVIQPQPVM